MCPSTELVRMIQYRETRCWVFSGWKMENGSSFSSSGSTDPRPLTSGKISWEFRRILHKGGRRAGRSAHASDLQFGATSRSRGHYQVDSRRERGCLHTLMTCTRCAAQPGSRRCMRSSLKNWSAIHTSACIWGRRNSGIAEGLSPQAWHK